MPSEPRRHRRHPSRAVLIRRSDLGSGGWQGGLVKPDLSAGPTCPNYHPKRSDLVITGAAEADFRRSALEFDSAAEVLKTPRMVALDWRRSVLAPGAVSCLRRTMSNGLGSGAKLVSFYLTMGQFDAVVISDAPDDQTVAKLALAAAGRGNVRTETLRAFTEDEAKSIAAEL